MISFFVPGKPVPQGSKRWVGRMIEANANLLPWRATVTEYARRAMTERSEGAFPITGPIYVTMRFSFQRPKAHYGTGKNAGRLKDNAPHLHPSVPDLDKLIRAVNDGITDSGMWQDDAQVVTLYATKFYSEQPGVTVEVEPL